MFSNNTTASINNNTGENTEDIFFEFSDISYEFKIFLVVAIILIITVALFGNGIILYAFFSVKKLRTKSNVFIISLSASDLTHAIFIMPIEVKNFLHPIWVLGVTVCELNNTLFLTAISASMWSLFGVSCYKYLTIAYPFFAQKLSLKHSMVFIIMFWIYSVTSSSLPALGWRNVPTYIIDGECQFDFTETWFVFFYTCNFFLPSVLMIIMYTLIFCIAKKHAHEIQKLEERLHCSDNNAKRPKKNLKAARTMGKIFLVYLICWLPYTLLLMSYVTCSSCRGVSRYIHNFFTLLAYSNSAINPFLYATWCQDFRSVLKGILCWKKKKNNDCPSDKSEMKTLKTLNENNLLMSETPEIVA